MKYLLPVLIFIAFSCGNKHTFVVEKEMPENDIWTFENPLDTGFEAAKDIPFDIYFELVHTDDYPFENIYLRIVDDFEDKIDTDIVNLNLANPYGIWYGEKSGGEYTFSALLRKKFKFENSDKHTIKIEQFTRKDSLEGVKSVRFYLDKNSDTEKN